MVRAGAPAPSSLVAASTSGSYWFNAADPAVGDLVDVRFGSHTRIRAHVETVAPDGEVLWVAGSAHLPRTLFLRQDDADLWVARPY